MILGEATPEEVEQIRKRALKTGGIDKADAIKLTRRIDSLNAQLLTKQEWVSVGCDDLIRMTNHALATDQDLAEAIDALKDIVANGECDCDQWNYLCAYCRASGTLKGLIK